MTSCFVINAAENWIFASGDCTLTFVCDSTEQHAAMLESLPVQFIEVWLAAGCKPVKSTELNVCFGTIVRHTFVKKEARGGKILCVLDPDRHSSAVDSPLL